AIALSVAVAMTWLVVADSLNGKALLHTFPFAPGTSFGTLLRIGFGHAPLLTYQMIGVLGWNDTLLPTAIYWAELAAVGFFVVLALSDRSVRTRVAVAGLLVTAIVLPAVTEAREGTTIGFIWSGRYTL